MNPPNLQAILVRLEKWLAKHRRRFLTGLRPGVSSTELVDLRKGFGQPLPAELRLLLSWHNGQFPDFVGKFEEEWQLMSSADILEAWKELKEDKTGWQSHWIPFLDNDAGDFRFLDTKSPTPTVCDFWLGEKDRPTIAPSLSAWLEDVVSHMEKGEYQEDPERGTFMRKS
jgi:cell wall assembly regulator SMI1